MFPLLSCLNCEFLLEINDTIHRSVYNMLFGGSVIDVFQTFFFIVIEQCV